MANSVTFIKRSALPQVVKGKLATDPKVTISDKGQLTLNPVATKFLEGNGKVGLVWDATNKLVYFYRPDSPVMIKFKADPEEFIEFKAPKAKEGKKAKGNILMLSFGTALQRAFGDHVYNYKDSGSQTFPLTLDEAKKCMSFTLPNGALKKNPVIKRKSRKTAPATTAATAAPAANAATAQAVNGSDKTPTPPPAAEGGTDDTLVLE